MTAPRLSEAIHHGRSLAERTLDALLQPEDKRQAKSNERRRRLKSAELPALMLYAGVLVRTFTEQERAALTRVPAPYEAGTGAPLSRNELRQRIGKTNSDNFLASDIVERYVRPLIGAQARAHYNVACFYSGLGTHHHEAPRHVRRRCEDLALAELDLALNDASLVPWAMKDPSLAELKEHREDDWTKVLGRHAAKAHPAAPASAPAVEAPATQPQQPTPGIVRRGLRWIRGVGVQLLTPAKGVRHSLRRVPALLQRMLRGRPARTVRAYTEWLSQGNLEPGPARRSDVADFEIPTSEGVILVTVHRRPQRPLSAESVESAARASQEWEARHERTPYRSVVIAAEEAPLDPEVVRLASESEVQIMRVSRAGEVFEETAETAGA